MLPHTPSMPRTTVLLSALAVVFAALSAPAAPSVSWGSYLGGAQTEQGNGIAVDSAGNIYAVGQTNSAGWVSGGWDTSLDSSVAADGYVVKLNAAGEHVWSAYIGGDGGTDSCAAVAVDASGNAYVTGNTTTPGWVGGGWRATHPGTDDDGFVIKLDSYGSHVWSTYIGGDSPDIGTDVAVDGGGNVYAAGVTQSPSWVAGGWDTSHSGFLDAYLVKLNAEGGHEWSTFLGGTSDDLGYGVAVDGSGNVHVTGTTTSSAWAGAGGWDATLDGLADGFIAKFSPMGGYLWSTYVGGAGQDGLTDVVVDAGGTLYATGYTMAGEWASGGWDTTFAGDSDGVVVKLASDGSHVWSTYFGGALREMGRGIVLTPAGDVCVAGDTKSAGWTSGGWNSALVENGVNIDGCVVKLGTAGAHIWSSCTGGTFEGAGQTNSYAIAVSSGGSLCVTGATLLGDWLAGGWDTQLDGVEMDAYVLKITDPPSVAVPNVVSMTQTAAGAALGAAGLAVGAATTAYSDTVPAGQVISQNPVAGTQVSTGTPVALVVSLGTQTAGTTVPNVVGMTRTAAEAAITAANLTVGTVSEATSLTVPAGQVISQSPAVDTSVPVGTAVSFTVSLGLPPSVTVPNVVGMTQEAAMAALTAAGLVHGTTTNQYSDAVAQGLICAQTPAAGTSAAPGTEVNLLHSIGPDPDLVADAHDTLADGFNDADADDSDTLTLAEAQTVIPTLTQLTFNALDTNADGVLGREELGADNGCGCGGCSCERSAMTFGGLKRRLGDLFLGGLALALLAVMGRRAQP